MYTKIAASILAIAFLAPASVRAQRGPFFIPGFGEGLASVSMGGVGSDGLTTLIAVPTVTAGGEFVSISGPVTVLTGGSGSEAKFQLVDGSNVDSKCSINGNQAACSAIIVNGGNTQIKVLQTQIPIGFGGNGAPQAMTQTSSQQAQSTSQAEQSTSQAGQSGSGQPSQTSSGFSTSVTQATDSSTPSSAQPAQSGKSNGALKTDMTGAGALILGGLVASLIL